MSKCYLIIETLWNDTRVVTQNRPIIYADEIDAKNYCEHWNSKKEGLKRNYIEADFYDNHKTKYFNPFKSAKDIAEEFRKSIPYNNRQVSVKSNYGMITVTLKDRDVDKKQIEKIIDTFNKRDKDLIINLRECYY